MKLSASKAKKVSSKKGFGEASKLKTKTIDQYGAYDQERAFLTEVLESGEYLEPLTSRVSDQWFADEDNRLYFKWIDVQFALNGKVPSPERFQEEFPQFVGLTTGDSIKELVFALREKRTYQEVSLVQKKAAELMRTSAQAAATYTLEAMSEVMARMSESTDTPVAKTRHRIKDTYNEAKNTEGMIGTPWPWEALNRASRGARKGQYIAFYGPPGSMKTFIAMYLACHFEQVEGETVMLVSMEMTDEEMELRYAAQMAGVDYEKVEGGGLSPKDEKKFLRAIDDMEESKFRIFCPVTTGKSALAELDAKIVQHKPRIVIIDGLGMLPADNEHGAFADINKGLKRIAKQRKVTIIVIHHTNREKVKDKVSEDTGDVALGDTLHRYCDVLCRVVREEQHKDDKEILLAFIKIRNGKTPCAFTIYAKPGITFAQKMIVKQVDRKNSADDEDEEDVDIAA